MKSDLEFLFVSENIAFFFLRVTFYHPTVKIVLITKTWAGSGLLEEAESL